MIHRVVKGVNESRSPGFPPGFVTIRDHSWSNTSAIPFDLRKRERDWTTNGHEFSRMEDMWMGVFIIEQCA